MRQECSGNGHDGEPGEPCPESSALVRVCGAVGEEPQAFSAEVAGDLIPFDADSRSASQQRGPGRLTRALPLFSSKDEHLAERVGFEPTEELPPHILSRDAPSAGLGHRSRVRQDDTNAERVGFEPTDPCGSTVFKTVAFVRSATAPNGTLDHPPTRARQGWSPWTGTVRRARPPWLRSPIERAREDRGEPTLPPHHRRDTRP